MINFLRRILNIGKNYKSETIENTKQSLKERKELILAEIVKDSWLIYCANLYKDRIDWWLSVAQFDRDIINAFKKRDIKDFIIPTKDEIGKIIKEYIFSDNCVKYTIRNQQLVPYND